MWAQMSRSRPVARPTPTILLDVRPATPSGDLGPRASIPEDFKLRAPEIADSIGDIVDHFRSRLGQSLEQRNDSSWRVRTLEIGFDIAVQAEAGVVIAKATAGATFSARLVLYMPGQDPE